ncbi:MAG: hypothetical protein COU33_04315, partial [Candidatus Magasanikbacteria bacterium CG10_big_fil_rev_8_21_14_0_10_43_6]
KAIKTKKIIAIRPSSLPLHAYKELKKNKLLNIKEFKGKESIFSIKSDPEIARIEKAAKLTDILYAELIDNWKSFITEADAAQFLLTKMAERGIEPSFDPIIASGSNAANPHHSHTQTKLNKGFCVIDMGIRYQGYCSDMTRTIYIGKPSKAEKELYEKIREAQVETVALVAPGLRIQDLDIFCRKKLGKELNKQFIHTLGHGLGTQVHEWPRVSNNVNIKLQPGMYITIEPGVYKQGSYGIRIEDDILVTSKKHKVLTSSSKVLIEV